MFSRYALGATAAAHAGQPGRRQRGCPVADYQGAQTVDSLIRATLAGHQGGIDPDTGGITLVDLGVVNAVDLLAGPKTLYTPSAGQYVALTVGPDSFVAMDHQSYDIVPNDRLSLLASMAPLVQVAPNQTAWYQFLPPGSNRLTAGGVQTSAPIKAVLQTDTNTISILGPTPAWAATHLYAANVVILGPDNHWWSSGAGGTSAGTIPNFAGNEGGTVVDGSVTWTDEGAIPTTGSLHLYALVGSTH